MSMGRTNDLRNFLGLSPTDERQVAYEVVEEEGYPGYRRQLIRYPGSEDDSIPRLWSSRWRELFVAAQNQKRTVTLASAQPTVSRVAISASLRNLGNLTTRSLPIRQGIPYLKTSPI